MDTLVAWAVVALVVLLMLGFFSPERTGKIRTGIMAVVLAIAGSLIFVYGLTGQQRIMYYDHVAWSSSTIGKRVDFCLFVDDMGEKRPCRVFSLKELRVLEARPAERK